ncbi:MAG: hypothetical protein EA369_07850 [Bradymonadales bacterium]|nr:MAG: hypothetical protein EA369_07850 [Bradymonadales bacterium]
MVASDPLQITVEYRLKNSCERLARTNVFPHEEHRRVLQLVSEAYREPREDCQDGNFIRKVRVPLGPLPVGSYELRNYHRLAQRFGKLEVKVVDEDSVLEHRLAFSYDPILR